MKQFNKNNQIYNLKMTKIYQFQIKFKILQNSIQDLVSKWKDI